jgi:hypothetical protein
MPPRFYTFEEVAELLRVSPRTLREQLAKILPEHPDLGRVVGKRQRVFSEADVDRLYKVLPWLSNSFADTAEGTGTYAGPSRAVLSMRLQELLTEKSPRPSWPNDPGKFSKRASTVEKRSQRTPKPSTPTSRPVEKRGTKKDF